MKHDDYKELLHLSFYDELNEEDRGVLDDHLLSCNSCREELAQMRKLGTLLNSSERIEITDQLLDEARRELRVALRLERSKRPFWAGLTEKFDAMTSPSTRFALGGAFMVVVGLASGYLLFKPAEGAGVSGMIQAVGQTSTQSTETKISNFRFVGQPVPGNEVEFTFDMVTPVHLKGNLNDAVIQRVMAQALMNDQNPGARLRTVSAIANDAETLNSSDKEIKAALLRAVEGDPNVGVRKQALRALQRFPLDSEIRDALIFVLKHEDNPGIRIDAISHLHSPELSRQLVDQDLLSVLKEKMKSDNNNYVRTRAKQFYEEVQPQ